MQSGSELDPAEVTRLAVELAPLAQKRKDGTLTDAEHARLDELVEILVSAGIVVDLTIRSVTPARPFVPKGSVLGADGIIRTAPGVFEARYRREVLRRGHSDPRYRAEARALLRRPGARLRPVVHAPERREFRPKPRARVHARRGPPREDDPDLDDPDRARR